VLRAEEPRAALLGALERCDRVVLLGDLLELRHGPLRDALAAARPVLEAIGAAIGAGNEVVIVPGNHDHLLLRSWLARRAAVDGSPPLGLATEVDWRDEEPLATVADMFGPADVRASYPGFWIREDVYAIHGHYTDRLTTAPILERLGAGLMSRVVAEPEGGVRTAEDYEGTLGPMYAWIDAVAQSGGVGGHGSGGFQVRAWRVLHRTGGRRGPFSAVAALGFGAAVAALNRAGLGPLRPDVSGPELRRAGLRAAEEMLERLGAGARHAIFGHTHRAGPLTRDEPTEWRTTRGTELMNVGSWVYEASFVGDSPGDSPYRPGFAAVVEDSGAPELENLLGEKRGRPTPA
jgi:hypothetical protein